MKAYRLTDDDRERVLFFLRHLEVQHNVLRESGIRGHVLTELRAGMDGIYQTVMSVKRLDDE